MKMTGWFGLVTAFASSLCCTVPLIALIVGITGSSGRWGWIEPLRPYSIAMTAVALGWAWYEQLKPKKNTTMNCACDTKKPSFLQTKKFLGLITGLSLLLLTFPSYSNWLIQEQGKPVVQSGQATAQRVAYVTIKGMTCEGCEQHVKQEINKLKGIEGVNVSYQKGSATVKYDSSKTSLAEIKKAVDATGYKAVNTKIL